MMMDTDDMMMTLAIIHFKDRNRYTSLDGRGPCSLDASELQIQQDYIIVPLYCQWLIVNNDHPYNNLHHKYYYYYISL